MIMYWISVRQTSKTKSPFTHFISLCCIAEEESSHIDGRKNGMLAGDGCELSCGCLMVPPSLFGTRM
jgi:hypothetical protein